MDKNFRDGFEKTSGIFRRLKNFILQKPRSLAAKNAKEARKVRDALSKELKTEKNPIWRADLEEGIQSMNNSARGFAKRKKQ